MKILKKRLYDYRRSGLLACHVCQPFVPVSAVSASLPHEKSPPAIVKRPVGFVLDSPEIVV